MQVIVTLNTNLSMWQRTQFMMRYEALATASVRTNGIVLSTEQGEALVAALDADPDVASYAPFVPAAVDYLADFGDTLDAIGVLPVAPAQPSEWEMRGNGE